MWPPKYATFFLFQTSVSTNQNVTSLGSLHYTVQRQSNCVCSVHNVLQLLEGDLTSRLHTVLRCGLGGCRNIGINNLITSTSFSKLIYSPTNLFFKFVLDGLTYDLLKLTIQLYRKNSSESFQYCMRNLVNNYITYLINYFEYSLNTTFTNFPNFFY